MYVRILQELPAANFPIIYTEILPAISQGGILQEFHRGKLIVQTLARSHRKGEFDHFTLGTTVLEDMASPSDDFTDGTRRLRTIFVTIFVTKLFNFTLVRNCK